MQIFKSLGQYFSKKGKQARKIHHGLELTLSLVRVCARLPHQNKTITQAKAASTLTLL